MSRVKLLTCTLCDPTFLMVHNNCGACSLWAGWREVFLFFCNYRVLECADTCDIWENRINSDQNLTSWQCISSRSAKALTVTSDLTLVWGDQNSGIHLKLGCWSWIPSAELSEGSTSFCIPRRGLYLANNLHLDSVVLLVSLSEKSYILSFARCSQDMV